MSEGPHDLVDAVTSCVDRAALVQWDGLPHSTQEATRRVVLDSLGVASAGRRAPGVTTALEALALSAGRGDVPVPWLDVTLPAADAAMALSWLIHGWDYDDTHDAAVLHSAAVAVAAAYAVAHDSNATGDRFLEGVVAGVETTVRLSLALGVQRGVIRTSGLAPIGAAAAAARVLGLDAVRTRSALALATPLSMSPTSRQILADSGETKRLQPGFGVRHGVLSAYLARAGVQGAPGWFSGQFGLAALVGDQDAASRHLTRSGWEVDRLSLKPYPSCRFTHASIAGALRLAEAGVTPEDVDSVEVHVPAGAAHATVARPWARRGTPLNDSQFSVPWMMATALTTGGAGLDVLTEDRLADRSIEGLASRIRVVQDVVGDESGLTPVRILVRTVGGAARRVTVEAAPGSAEHPLAWSDVAAKVAGCLLLAGLPAQLAEDLADCVQRLGPEPLRGALRPATEPVQQAAVPT